METIENQQVYVRKWQNEDVTALLALGKNRSMRKNWSYSYPYTLKKAQDCIQFFIHANPLRYAMYAIFINDQLCGYIQVKGLAHQCAEITFWLNMDHPDIGVIKAILKQTIPLAFAHLDILTLYMKIAMEEETLRQALLQLGFIENNETVPIYLYFLHSCTLPFTKQYSNTVRLHS